METIPFPAGIWARGVAPGCYDGPTPRLFYVQDPTGPDAEQDPTAEGYSPCAGASPEDLWEFLSLYAGWAPAPAARLPHIVALSDIALSRIRAALHDCGDWDVGCPPSDTPIIANGCNPLEDECLAVMLGEGLEVFSRRTLGDFCTRIGDEVADLLPQWGDRRALLPRFHHPDPEDVDFDLVAEDDDSDLADTVSTTWSPQVFGERLR